MRLLTSLFITIFFGTLSLAQSGKPFVLGTIEEIQSQQLGEKRTLNIYLPEGYNAADTVKYQIIYLLDGSADEDFIHVAGLVQYSSFPWINMVPPTILVGIANVDRRRDFSFPSNSVKDKKNNPTSGHSDKFMAFIEKELQPFIDKKYKTSGQKTLIGESLGGLLATEILFKKPQLFDKYLIISPSLWWNDGSLLDYPAAVYQENFTQKITVYIGVGKEGITPSEKPRVMEVDANMLADKLEQSKAKNIRLYFDYLPQHNHASIGYQALYNGFKFLYSEK